MLHYQNFNDTVLSAVDMHTPKKMKCIRSSNCNFITKELRKAIMNSSKLIASKISILACSAKLKEVVFLARETLP